MKKNISLFTSILCFISIGFTQPLHIDWQNCFGGPDDDDAWDLLYTGDGILVTGYSEGDTWLFKTDMEGNLLWEKDLNDTVTAGAGRILKSTDGNYFIVAQTGSEIKKIVNRATKESANYMIIKIDGSGNIIWEHTYGGSCWDNIWDGVSTSDGGLVITGYTCSEDGDITNYYGSWDNWIIKVDKEGNKVWDLTIGTSDVDYGTSVIETTDHGLLVASASTPGPGGNVECEPFNENAEIILFKLDSNANIEWQKCYGGSDHDWAHAMIETDNGYLIASSGGSDDGDLEGSGYHYGYDYLYNNTSDFWLARMDYSGNIIWQKCYGGTNNDWPIRVFHNEAGGFVVFGVTSSHDGDVFGNHGEGEYGYNIWSIAITGSGELLYQQCIGGSEEVIESAVKISESEYAIVADVVYGPRGDVTCDHTGNQDAWLLKVTNTMVGIDEQTTSGNIFKVYPNPAKEYVVFEFIKDERIKPFISGLTETSFISITDIFGRLVTKIPVRGEKTVWDARGIKPGIYFYNIRKQESLGNGKMIVGISGE